MASQDYPSPLFDAIGRCILAWARCEIQLVVLLRGLVGKGPNSYEADIVWDRLRQFDTKLEIINDLIAKRQTDQNALNDWRLLMPEIRRAARMRNKVAHATLVGGDHIEPFFSLGKATTEKLKPDDIHKFTNEIADVTACIRWWQFTYSADPSQRQQWTGPDPDRVQRLRKEDAQKREVQRHRALAWRQYLDRNPDLNL